MGHSNSIYRKYCMKTIRKLSTTLLAKKFYVTPFVPYNNIDPKKILIFWGWKYNEHFLSASVKEHFICKTINVFIRTSIYTLYDQKAPIQISAMVEKFVCIAQLVIFIIFSLEWETFQEDEDKFNLLILINTRKIIKYLVILQYLYHHRFVYNLIIPNVKMNHQVNEFRHPRFFFYMLIIFHALHLTAIIVNNCVINKW